MDQGEERRATPECLGGLPPLSMFRADGGGRASRVGRARWVERDQSGERDERVKRAERAGQNESERGGQFISSTFCFPFIYLTFCPSMLLLPMSVTQYNLCSKSVFGGMRNNYLFSRICFNRNIHLFGPCITVVRRRQVGT